MLNLRRQNERFKTLIQNAHSNAVHGGTVYAQLFRPRDIADFANMHCACACYVDPGVQVKLGRALFRRFWVCVCLRFPVAISHSTIYTSSFPYVFLCFLYVFLFFSSFLMYFSSFSSSPFIVLYVFLCFSLLSIFSFDLSLCISLFSLLFIFSFDLSLCISLSPQFDVHNSQILVRCGWLF